MKIFFLLLNLIFNVFAVDVAHNLQNSPLLLPKAAIEADMLEVKTNQGRYATNNDMILAKRISVDEMLEKTKFDPRAILQRAWFKIQNHHLSVFQLYSDGNCEEMDWYPLFKKETLGEYSEGRASLNYKHAGNQCRDHKFVGLPNSLVELPSWFHDGYEFQKKCLKADLLQWTNLDQKTLNHTVTRRQMYRAFLNEAYRFKDEPKYMCVNFGNNIAEFLTGQKPINTNMLTAGFQLASVLGVTCPPTC